MRNMKNIENIKKIHQLKACAVGVLLSVSMQNSHASGVPTIDGAVLGNGIQEFISQTAEHAEEAARWIATKVEWADRLKNWTKQFDVVRQGFDVIKDVQSIAGSIGEMTDFVDELKNTVKSIEEKGAAGLAQDLLKEARGSAYETANKKLSDNCALVGKYEEELVKLDKEISKKEKESLKKTKDMAGTLGGKNSLVSGSTKATSIAVGVSVEQSKALAEAQRHDRLRSKLISGREEADKLCIASMKHETKDAVQKGTFGVQGGGMTGIFKASNDRRDEQKNNMLDPKPN